MYIMDQTIQHTQKHSFKWNITNMEREKSPVEWEKIAHRMLFIDGNGRPGDVFAEGCQSRERDRHLLKKERDQQTTPEVEFKKYCHGCGTGTRNLSSL